MWREHDSPGARREEQLLLPGMGEWQVVRAVMSADPRRGAGAGGCEGFLERCGGGSSLEEGLEGQCAGVWRERGGEGMPGEPVRIRSCWPSLVVEWIRIRLPLQGTAGLIRGPEGFHMLASKPMHQDC